MNSSCSGDSDKAEPSGTTCLHAPVVVSNDIGAVSQPSQRITSLIPPRVRSYPVPNSTGARRTVQLRFAYIVSEKATRESARRWTSFWVSIGHHHARGLGRNPARLPVEPGLLITSAAVRPLVAAE